MVSERLKILFGNVKKRLGEIKPEDIANFVAKEAVGAIPVVGSIIKDAIDEFSEDEKEELIEELKELSEAQFTEISEKVGVSVEYLKDIQGIALYTFEELRADHEEIKELILHLIEIQTREVKLAEIAIPAIQSVLRKGETFEGDFFKKEPEWIDFKEGFVVERKEVDEIINKLENDTIQLVLGEPASGKSVIMKNIGFKLANENKDVYVVELKKHSGDEVKRYFDDIPEIKAEKAVFIVDDAHLLPAECERLVRQFKNRKLKAKLVIGSRPTREIRGEHLKEASEFEYLSKRDIHAKDVTEEMVKTFLKRKHHFSDERIERVSKNLEEYKKDLWHLSWALKAYKPEKDSVEEKEIYEKIKDSIRNISAGKDRPRINAEDVFLPLSVFYRFEIPIERNFLEEQERIKESIINQLIDVSEIIEKEERGKRRTLSLIHSSIADLYFETYQSYPDFGGNAKNHFQIDEEDMEYSLFHQYLTSAPTNLLDVVNHLGLAFIIKRGSLQARHWKDEKRGLTLLKKLVEDEEIEDSIKEGIEKEEDIEKIGLCMMYISNASFVEGRVLSNRLNIDNLLSKIEKEEDPKKIGSCVGMCVFLIEELINRIDVDNLAAKIEKEEDVEKIGSCVSDFAVISSEMKGLKFELELELVNRIDVDNLAAKIEKGEDIREIGDCVSWIAWVSKEVGLRLANRINVDNLASKIEKEEYLDTIREFILHIKSVSKEVALKLVNRIDIDNLVSKIEKEEDIGTIERFIGDIESASEEVALKLVNRIDIDNLVSKIEKEEEYGELEIIGYFLKMIAGENKEIAQEIINRLNPELIEELREEGWLK